MSSMYVYKSLLFITLFLILIFYKTLRKLTSIVPQSICMFWCIFSYCRCTDTQKKQNKQKKTNKQEICAHTHHTHVAHNLDSVYLVFKLGDCLHPLELSAQVDALDSWHKCLYGLLDTKLPRRHPN